MSDLLVNYTQEFLNKKSEQILRIILHKNFQIVKGTSKLDKQQLIDLILENNKVQDKQLVDNKGIDQALIYKDEFGFQVKAKYQPETPEIDECVITTDIDGNVDYPLLEEFNKQFKKMRYCDFNTNPPVVVEEFNPDTKRSVPVEDSNQSEPINNPCAEIPIPEQDRLFRKLKNVQGAQNAFKRIGKEIMQRFGYLSDKEDGYIQEKSRIDQATVDEFRITYGFNSLQEAITSLENTPAIQKEKVKEAKKPSTGSKTSNVISIVKKFIDEGTEYTSGTVMKELKRLYGQDVHRSFCITLMNRAKNS